MQVINGSFFKQMLTNALNNLYSSESEINRMNVFPVPDGDTGTNMLMTLEPVRKSYSVGCRQC